MYPDINMPSVSELDLSILDNQGLEDCKQALLDHVDVQSAYDVACFMITHLRQWNHAKFFWEVLGKRDVARLACIHGALDLPVIRQACVDKDDTILQDSGVKYNLERLEECNE